MRRNYTPEKRDEIQKRLTDLVRKNGRMTFGELRKMTGLTIFTARHYLEVAERCGDLYQAGRSGIFPSERDFRIWKRKQDDARVECFLNAKLVAGEPYDRNRNSVCEECRNSYVMQRILAFYRGVSTGSDRQMKIEYQDGGEESRLLITSWFFDWREHNRLVDEVLFCAPRLRAVDEGFFRRTTVISGATAWVMCAEVTVEENGYEVRRVSQ